MAISAEEVERARGWLDAVEAALVAQALAGRSLSDELDLAASLANLDEAARCAGLAVAAAKFLAVGTPRTLALVGAGQRAAAFLAAQSAYAAPREVRVYEPVDEEAAAIAAALGSSGLSARATSLQHACACDIVVVAAPVAIRREWIRAGTHVTIVDASAILDADLLAIADVYSVDAGARRPARVGRWFTLGAVAAGHVDGRQLDEITVMLAAPQADDRTAASAVAPPTCDVLLLVTTETEEFELLSAATDLRIGWRRCETPRLGPYVDLGMVGGDRVFAVRTRLGATRHRGSLHAALLFHLETQASALIQVGMAFGVSPATQRAGDVLVASTIIPYDDRDITERDGQIVTSYARVRRRRAKPALVEMLRREAAREARDHRVHVGAVLSGGARIWSARFRDRLVQEVPTGDDPIVGGEMEGLGPAAVTPADRPLWAIVKGICDFADEDRDELIGRARAPACYNAARFVLTSLRNLPSHVAR